MNHSLPYPVTRFTSAQADPPAEPMQRTVLRALVLCLVWVLLLAAGAAWADPPTRVARLGYLDREVSFLPAGAADWEQAALNQPLGTGDRLWTDREAAAELQLGGAALRLGERSNLSVLNLDDRIVQLQLTQGAVRLRVRSMGNGQSFEVDTPNLAVSLRRSGDYRIDVDPQGDATTVTVLSGEAEVFGDAAASYRVLPNQAYRFYATGLSDYELLAPAPADALDRWAQAREQRSAAATSARYVSSEVVGYEDLDANGVWRQEGDYGYVWTPTRVVVGWSPFRDGRWTWMQPWGWTWVDAAPWGYAVSHYGRWAHIRDAWCWVPGPLREPAVYAPALVVVVGVSDFRTSPERGRWFPLAPREVYRPAYPVSQGYFERVNRSNAVIAPNSITTVYNNKTVNNTVYINQQVRGALVQPQTQPVRQAPAEARSRPPRDNTPVLARTAPPAPPVPAATAAEPVARVRVVPAAAAPRELPPPVAPAVVRKEGQRDQRGPQGEQGQPVQQGQQGQQGQPGPRDTRDQRRPEPAPTAAAAPVVPAQTAPPRADAARADAARAQTAQQEAAKAADAARANAERAASERNAQAKEQAGKAEASRNAAVQAEAGRTAAAQAEAARNAAAQAEASRNAAAREQASKAAAPRPEPARAAPGNVDKREDPEHARGPKDGRKLTPEEEELLRRERGQKR